MSKIKLNTEQTMVDLDALLGNVSATDKPIKLISVSDTDTVSATDISVTKDVSDTDKPTVSATDSRGKYQNEWVKNNRDVIRFNVPKGTKALLQAEAKQRDMSLTELIKKSIEMYLDHSK